MKTAYVYRPESNMASADPRSYSDWLNHSRTSSMGGHITTRRLPLRATSKQLNVLCVQAREYERCRTG
jgi:hypothetical protein